MEYNYLEMKNYITTADTFFCKEIKFDMSFKKSENDEITIKSCTGAGIISKSSKSFEIMVHFSLSAEDLDNVVPDTVNNIDAIDIYENELRFENTSLGYYHRAKEENKIMLVFRSENALVCTKEGKKTGVYILL